MTLDERGARAADDIRQAVRSGLAPVPRATRPFRPGRLIAASATGLLTGSVVVFAVLIGQAMGHRHSPPVTLAQERGLLLYGQWDQRHGLAHWFTIRPDGTAMRNLHIAATCAVWWPDASRILITDDETAQSTGSPLRPAVVSPDGTHLRVLDATRDQELNLGCGDVSPDGTTLALEGFNDAHPTLKGLYTVRASDGGGLVRLTHSPLGGADGNPRFSPDGKRIVFLRTIPGTSPEGAGALFITSAHGGNTRQITPQGSAFLGYGWSPDGQWIVFQKPYGQLYLVHPDGTGLHRLPVSLPANTGAQNPTWSADGRWIVFALEHNGQANVYAVQPDGTRLHAITQTLGVDIQWPAWSTG